MGKGKTLLWIDSDERVIDESTPIFAQHGFVILKATNANDALGILRTQASLLDGVFLSVRLRGSEMGKELLSTIPEWYPTLRINVFSAVPEDGVEQKDTEHIRYYNEAKKIIPRAPDEQAKFFAVLHKRFSGGERVSEGEDTLDLQTVGQHVEELSDKSKGIASRTVRIATRPIVVMSALDEELEYLYDIDFQWSDPVEDQDGITYRRGRLPHGVDIIATSAQRMGLTATAVTASKVFKQWKPAFAAMIGVCGGRKEKGVELGDIVVARQVFHYQFGAFENGRVIRELLVENTEPQLIATIEYLVGTARVLPEIELQVARGVNRPNRRLRCHIDVMASADLVVKDVQKMEEAIEADRKTIAVDMESYAFMYAARLGGIRRAAVMKSVTDFADAKKDDECRHYAKFTSTQFFCRLVTYLVQNGRLTQTA